jgi:hypothetical protein
MLLITVRNLGDHPQRPEYGNYEWAARINEVVIARGFIRGHRRADGWQRLAALIAADASAATQPPPAESHPRRRPRVSTRDAVDPVATAPLLRR